VWLADSQVLPAVVQLMKFQLHGCLSGI
jgi:hypothetical protein